ncbi:hypothetical protein Pfo_000982 [Paulownia fortunei]|nr:hypothetical protein Pfo_000982 [Paulownia fortunei]
MVPSYGGLSSCLNQSASTVFTLPTRNMTTMESTSQDASTSSNVPQRIKFKRLNKTARHIMQIIDKEAVQEVKANREIPDIRPGYIIQLKLEVPENKRRVSVLKGIVIARHNAGLSWHRISLTSVFSKYKGDKGVGQEESEEGQTLLSQR